MQELPAAILSGPLLLTAGPGAIVSQKGNTKRLRGQKSANQPVAAAASHLKFSSKTHTKKAELLIHSNKAHKREKGKDELKGLSYPKPNKGL